MGAPFRQNQNQGSPTQRQGERPACRENSGNPACTGGALARSSAGRLAEPLLGLLACLVFCSPLRAQPTAHEYAVKAALLFNFSQFVEWPAAAFPGEANAPFVIGILGEDPFGKFLDDLVKNERAHGRPIEVRRVHRKEDACATHILFVSKSEQARMDSILTSLRGKPVLTITDGEERMFPYRSGMIALDREGDKIKLCINLEAARSAGLTISAKVLRVADTVYPER